MDKILSFCYHIQGEKYESIIILKKRAYAHGVGSGGDSGADNYAAVVGAAVGYRLAHARHAVYDADGARGLQKGKYLPSAAQAGRQYPLYGGAVAVSGVFGILFLDVRHQRRVADNLSARAARRGISCLSSAWKISRLSAALC